MSMSDILHDARYAVRMFLKSPGFTAVVVLTLAVGIAANTTVFSWIDGVLLRPFPGVHDGNQLVVLEAVTPNGAALTNSYPDFVDYRDNLRLISGLAMHDLQAFSMGGAENAQRIWLELVSGNYFSVLGVKPLLGRVFLPEEYGDKPGAYPLAVISERLWRSRFSADPGVVGKTVRVNRRELTIIGVVPAEFRGTMPGLTFEMWVPLVMRSQLTGGPEGMLRDRYNRIYRGFARLKPGVTLKQAQAELAALSRQLATMHPDSNAGVSATLLPVWKSHLIGVPTLLMAPLQILSVVSFVMLLIACANVVNLLLARSIARQKELGIRLALGAGRGRLARQLLVEALLLAGLGALAAIPLALWMGQSLAWLLPANFPSALDVTLNGDVLGFTILICVVAALVSGMAPLLHSTRPDLNDALKEGGRGGTSGTHSHRLRGLLVVCEVALALVALIGAGLFARSFYNVGTIHPGFDARNVSVARFSLYTNGYSTDQTKQFCLRLRQRMEAAPGVVGASYSCQVPLAIGSSMWNDLEVEGYVPGRSENMRISGNLIAPGFLNLLRIPQVEGRDFSEHDDVKTSPVMIVNQTFARRFFGDRNPIGRKVKGWGESFTVVGVAKDSKYDSPVEAPQSFVYVPFAQVYWGNLDVAFYARSTGSPGETLARLRREVAAIDPGIAAVDAMPLSEFIGISLFPQKVAASLLIALGAISLLLAAVGLYSVMAYDVSQRTHEIGIRMALGARPGNVLGMVVRKGMVLTVAGLLLGSALALAAGRLVGGMLVNVSADDPKIYAGVGAFLASVALLASYLPARRATRVDPIVALRCE
jgi:predicted permease